MLVGCCITRTYNRDYCKYSDKIEVLGGVQNTTCCVCYIDISYKSVSNIIIQLESCFGPPGELKSNILLL